MKVFFNGWFDGFIDKTNPGLNYEFFLNLFEKVYNEGCEIGDYETSEILCEFDMLLNSCSWVNVKKWKHTYLFSGESYLRCNKKDYDCVLFSQRNHENTINVPLFIPYIYTNHFLQKLECIHKTPRLSVPTKDVCVLVSNTGGYVRNMFFDKLEKVMRVDYGGGYKTNIERVTHTYNTQEFIDFVSQYKFIISMENSREDTYITEKIVHGLLAKTVPVYWGSEKVHQYINEERIVNMKDINDIDMVIQKMIDIKNNDSLWLDIVNKQVFVNEKLERTLDIISKDIKCLLINQNPCKTISNIYCINNEIYEPERNVMLKNMFHNLNINSEYISYICPTYKHTITEEVYNTNIKWQNVFNLRNTPMKKSELSLFLNYKAVLEDIEKNYSGGTFLIFESDAMTSKDINKLSGFLDFIEKKKGQWDLVHIGEYVSNLFCDKPFIDFTGYNKSEMFINFINNMYSKDITYIEDITNNTSEFRLVRKFHTRCTDSFIWSYSGVIKFLNYMKNIEPNFGVPFDYYMCNFLENNLDFKHYWSVDEFFFQGSNKGLIQSTIQCDN